MEEKERRDVEEKKANNAANGKLSWPVRLSYAGGDVACNVVFGMVGTLLTLFYTDYVGVAADNRRSDHAVIQILRWIFRYDHGNHRRKDQFQMGKIKTMDLVDECTICAVCDPVIYCTAYDGSGSVDLYFCNL